MSANKASRMTARERVRRVLSGGIPDRVPMDDLYWATTKERWRREGLPQAISLSDHFDLDIVYIDGDYTLQLPERMVDETEGVRLYWDSDGALRRDSHMPDGGTS